MSFPYEALAEADRRCLDAAELLLDTLEQLPSGEGLRILGKEVARARATARSASRGTPFERTYARHLEISWEALERVARYRFEWPRVPVSRVLDGIAGEGAMNRLEAAVEGVDQREVWSYLELRQRYRAGRVSPASPEVRPFLEKSAKGIAASFREWLEAREGSLPGADAEVVLGEGDAGGCRYEPARHTVVVGPGEFMVFDRGGRLTVNPLIVLHGLSHELAGHAVQDALSRPLPEPLRPEHRARLRFASLPLAEGFAGHRTALAVSFAEEKKSELGLDDQDLTLLRRMVELGSLHHALPACVGALAARARQEPGFDAAGHLSRLAGHAGFGEMLLRASAEPINRVLYNAACHFGRETVTEAAAALAGQGVDEAERTRRLGTGGWALEVYPGIVKEGERSGERG